MAKLLKSFLLLSSLILFTACGSDSPESPEESAGWKTFEGSSFSMKYPQDWEVLEKKDFTSNVPPSTVVAFRNNIKDDIFTANLNINVGEADEKLTAEDYAKSTKSKLKDSLVGFTETKTEPVTLGEDLKGYELQFTGKKSSADPVINFRQIFIVNDGIGYTINAAYRQNEDESVVNFLNEMINSFSLK